MLRHIHKKQLIPCSEMFTLCHASGCLLIKEYLPSPPIPPNIEQCNRKTAPCSSTSNPTFVTRTFRNSSRRQLPIVMGLHAFARSDRTQDRAQLPLLYKWRACRVTKPQRDRGILPRLSPISKHHHSVHLAQELSHVKSAHPSCNHG